MSDDLIKTFGFNFKIERMKKKLTQEDIAEKTGFSLAYISNIENGKHDLSMKNAITLSRIVGKTIEELISDE